MSPGGEVLGPKLRTLVQGLAELYLNGDLVIVAGAGVSRASGLPGWDEMVAVLQKAAADDLSDKVDADELEAVLASLHPPGCGPGSGATTRSACSPGSRGSVGPFAARSAPGSGVIAAAVPRRAGACMLRESHWTL